MWKRAWYHPLHDHLYRGGKKIPNLTFRKCGNIFRLLYLYIYIFIFFFFRFSSWQHCRLCRMVSGLLREVTEIKGKRTQTSCFPHFRIFINGGTKQNNIKGKESFYTFFFFFTFLFYPFCIASFYELPPPPAEEKWHRCSHHWTHHRAEKKGRILEREKKSSVNRWLSRRENG